MEYQERISTLSTDPETLEQVYQAALQAGETEAFREAIESSYGAAPDNLLYAAWFHRLRQTAAEARGFVVAWGWVLPLALLNGLVFWFLSDDQRFVTEITSTRRVVPLTFIPTIFLLAAPISASFVLVYLTAVGRRRRGLALLTGLLLLAAGAYVLWVYPRAGTRPFQEQYLTLMAMHLPLLA